MISPLSYSMYFYWWWCIIEQRFQNLEFLQKAVGKCGLLLLSYFSWKLSPFWISPRAITSWITLCRETWWNWKVIYDIWIEILKGVKTPWKNSANGSYSCPSVFGYFPKYFAHFPRKSWEIYFETRHFLLKKWMDSYGKNMFPSVPF